METKKNRLLQAVIEETTDAIFMKDVKGRYVFMNSFASRYLQISKRKALGKRDIDLFPPKTAHRIATVDQNVTTTGESFTFEETVDIGGNEKVFHVTKIPYQDTKGKVIGLIGIVRDITEHKLEEKLRKSNKRLRTVINGAPIILSAIDKNGVITLTEGKGLQRTGRKWNERVGSSIYNVFRDAPRIINAAEHALAGESFTEVDKVNNGQLVYEINASPLYDEKGEVSGAIFVATDITKRKKVEDELRKNQETLAEAQRIACIGDWVHNLTTNQLQGSVEAKRIFGLPLNLPFLSWAEFLNIVHPEDREYVKQSHQRFLRDLMPYTLEYRIVLRDLTERIVLNYSKVSQKDDTGRPIRLHGTVQDITDRKQTEQALRQKDYDIRKAYVNVFSAVTDEKLVIMTDEEIQAVLGKPICKVYTISSLKKLEDSRTFLKDVLKKTLRKPELLDEIILASNEAITNGMKHAGLAEIQVYKTMEAVQIKISDHGPGIDFSMLPRVTLLSKFSTKKSLGVGFSIVLDVFDRVLLSTSSTGTTLILETDGKEKDNSLENIIERTKST